MYEYAIEHKQQLHVAFLDATSASGTAQHPVLTAAFSSIGASAPFVRWIKFMVAGHRRVIRTVYSMGDPASEFTIESSIPQGERPPLSPSLGNSRRLRTSARKRCWRPRLYCPRSQIAYHANCSATQMTYIALFANTHSQLHTTTQAIATALAGEGEVLESTLIRRLLFPKRYAGVAHIRPSTRSHMSQWVHRTLGFRGSATGNDNVADGMHTPRTCGGLGMPGIVNIHARRRHAHFCWRHETQSALCYQQR